MNADPAARTARDPGSDAVREALRALATGDRRAPRASADRRALVAEAEAALEGVEAAAGFAESGGFERLRSVAGEETGDAIRCRARAVLDVLARYRRAYRGSDGAGSDYFHRTLDSHNRGDGVGSDN